MIISSLAIIAVLSFTADASGNMGSKATKKQPGAYTYSKGFRSSSNDSLTLLFVF